MSDRSPEIAELAKALALAQSEIEHASKDSLNPHFNRSYADLASVWEACRGPLTKNGLSVVQLPWTDPGAPGISVKTILLHSSGQWIETVCSAIPQQPGPQAMGSCITYLRRYSLAALVGVAPADDDGEAASQELPGHLVRSAPRQPEKEAAPAAPKERAPLVKVQAAVGPTIASVPSAPDIKNYVMANMVPPIPGGPMITKDQLIEIQVLKKKLGWDDWPKGEEPHWDWPVKQWPKYRQAIGAYGRIAGDQTVSVHSVKELQEHQAANLLKRMRANAMTAAAAEERMKKELIKELGPVVNAIDVPFERLGNIDDVFDKVFKLAGEETKWLEPFGFVTRADIPETMHGEFIAMVNAWVAGGLAWTAAMNKFTEKRR